MSDAMAALVSSAPGQHHWPYFRSYTPTIRDTFGDHTAWGADLYNCTIADDAVNYSASGIDRIYDGSWVANTQHALKVTKGTVADHVKIRLDYGAGNTVDLSAAHPMIRFYVHPGTGDAAPEKVSHISLFFTDSAAGWLYDSRTFAGGADAGWYTLPLPRHGFGGGGGLDWTIVQKIEVRVYGFVNADVPVVTFDWLDLVPQYPTPIPMIVTFDGGYTNQYEALAYMAARGLRAVLYPTYDLCGSGGRMSVTQLQSLRDMGHYVAEHERAASPNGFGTMTDAQKVESVRQAVAWGAEHGFSGRGSFATLGATWSKGDADRLLLQPWLESIRISGTNNLNYWPHIMALSPGGSEPSSLANEQAARTAAVNAGVQYVLLFHNITTSPTLAVFKTMVDDWVGDTANVSVVTPAELASEDWYS